MHTANGTLPSSQELDAYFVILRRGPMSAEEFWRLSGMHEAGSPMISAAGQLEALCRIGWLAKRYAEPVYFFARLKPDEVRARVLRFVIAKCFEGDEAACDAALKSIITRDYQRCPPLLHPSTECERGLGAQRILPPGDRASFRSLYKPS